MHSSVAWAAQGKSGSHFLVSIVIFTVVRLQNQLCVSKEEEVKESFKGKDMTYEQYEQLKRLNDSHGQGPKEDDTDTKDSADAARRRYYYFKVHLRVLL